MGQRSQIYIRYDVKDYYGNEAVYYSGLIARYYQWNYGERMVSRARHVIELLQEGFMKYKWWFNDEEKLEKLNRFCDINFDMKDISHGLNILEEIREYCGNDTSYLFNQDNNDGQLFIDVTNDGIKYCFMKFFDDGTPMNAEEYMEWDVDKNWRNIQSKYFDKKTIAYTEENIEKINEIATLMTPEELQEFIEAAYLCFDDEDYSEPWIE